MQDDQVRNIIRVLHLTKSDSLERMDNSLEEDLRALGLDAHDLPLDRSQRIELAMRAIERGADAEEVIEELTWKDFEGLIASILEENGFRCVESFRRRGNGKLRGMEIDVIGIRGRLILSIDAKMWGIRSGKAAAIRKAAENQLARTRRLANELRILETRLGPFASGRYELIPVITTWLVEDLQFHEGVPIVPIFKFNSFVLQFNEFEDMVVRIEHVLD